MSLTRFSPAIIERRQQDWNSGGAFASYFVTSPAFSRTYVGPPRYPWLPIPHFFLFARVELLIGPNGTKYTCVGEIGGPFPRSLRVNSAHDNPVRRIYPCLWGVIAFEFLRCRPPPTRLDSNRPAADLDKRSSIPELISRRSDIRPRLNIL